VCLFFLEKTKQGEADDKIIAVCADDPEYRHFNDIKELPPHRLAEIRRFFEDCILIIITEFLFCSPVFPVIYTLSVV
jgi:inorganic pyrophosphatase